MFLFLRPANDRRITTDNAEHSDAPAAAATAR
jgi:hypothetical protein